MATAAGKKLAAARVKSRDEIWADAPTLVWSRDGATKGFTTIPRLLPLITALIKERSKTGDPSSVYWDLWARSFDECYVQIDNEEECAFSSGYTGTRALRTWRERMDQLVDQGFIRTAPSGIRNYAHVLLVNPMAVAAKLRKSGSPKVPDEWWNAFKERAAKVKADIPSV